MSSYPTDRRGVFTGTTAVFCLVGASLGAMVAVYQHGTEEAGMRAAVDRQVDCALYADDQEPCE
jgi:hypothetical protein